MRDSGKDDAQGDGIQKQPNDGLDGNQEGAQVAIIGGVVAIPCKNGFLSDQERQNRAVL